MASVIEALARQAQQTFTKNFGDEAFLDSFSKLKVLLNQVRAKDVNLNGELLAYSNPARESIPVTYVNLYENDVFSMGIFIIKDRARIPLHDHPKMYGLLKVLHGTLKIISYSHIGSLDRTGRIPKELKRFGKKSEVIPSKRNEDLEVRVESEPCILTPIENNFHEVRSVGGTAAFLDILAPPYTEERHSGKRFSTAEERDCHYYQHVYDQVKENSKISWLKEVTQPSDFYCDSESYTGPDIDLNKG